MTIDFPGEHEWVFFTVAGPLGEVVDIITVSDEPGTFNDDTDRHGNLLFHDVPICFSSRMPEACRRWQASSTLASLEPIVEERLGRRSMGGEAF